MTENLSLTGISRAIAIAILAACCAWAQAPLAGSTPDLPWAVLEFSAHKLVVSTSARVEARRETAAVAASELVAPAQGTPLDVPAEGVVWLSTSMTVMGRTFESHLWMNPTDGSALQLLETETGAKHHRRLSRFCRTGVFEETRVPANVTETAVAPENWTQVSTQFLAFPPEKSGPVLGPAGLLWLLGGPEVAKAGDRATVQVWAKGQLENATAEVTGSTSLSGITVAGPTGTSQSGPIDALVIAVAGVPVDPAATSNLQLMGLEGNLGVSLDPATRAPVELDGSAPIVGSMVVRLTSVELANPQNP